MYETVNMDMAKQNGRLNYTKEMFLVIHVISIVWIVGAADHVSV